MTITTDADVSVPADLLPIMRKCVLMEIQGLGDKFSHAGTSGCATVDEVCDDADIIIAVYRALKPETTTYPASVVAVALDFVIQDAASRFADDQLDVDQAELYVRRVRAGEALQAQIDTQAVTA